MSNNATPQQKKAINTILHKRGLMAYKAEMIGGLTNGRTEHSSELTFAEAAALITSLNQDKAAAQTDDGKKMRGSIIAMAHELGWIKETTVVTAAGIKPKKDYTSLDNWMLHFSYLKKKLFDYTYAELPKLVTQFKQVYQSFLKK